MTETHAERLGNIGIALANADVLMPGDLEALEAGAAALRQQSELVEALPNIGEARERLNVQLRCMADEIRAWGTVVDANVDDAIDALIVAAALTERARINNDRDGGV